MKIPNKNHNFPLFLSCQTLRVGRPALLWCGAGQAPSGGVSADRPANGESSRRRERTPGDKLSHLKQVPRLFKTNQDKLLISNTTPQNFSHLY